VFFVLNALIKFAEEFEETSKIGGGGAGCDPTEGIAVLVDGKWELCKVPKHELAVYSHATQLSALGLVPSENHNLVD
jgi:hypothetical protein